MELLQINPLYGNDVVGCTPVDEDAGLVARAAAELTGAKATLTSARRLLERLPQMSAHKKAEYAKDGITINSLMASVRNASLAVTIARAEYERTLEITGLKGEDL